MRADDPAIVARIASGEFFAVLHNAGISDTTEARWDLLEESNVQAPLRLASACAVSGTRFIYASSSSVYGAIRRLVPVPERGAGRREWCSGPLNHYARSKLLLDERMTALRQDSSWTGLRYTNVFGTGEEHKGRMACILTQLLRRAASTGQVELFSDTLRAARDYIPVACVADTIIHILENAVPSGVYNLGSGHATTFAEILQWCAELRDGAPLDVRLIRNSFAAGYQYWTCADMTALRCALPGVPRIAVSQLRQAATELYATFTPGVLCKGRVIQMILHGWCRRDLHRPVLNNAPGAR
jgi:ADP-L-glycero-D-manno-heptose 6-epimerase